MPRLDRLLRAAKRVSGAQASGVVWNFDGAKAWWMYGRSNSMFDSCWRKNMFCFSNLLASQGVDCSCRREEASMLAILYRCSRLGLLSLLPFRSSSRLTRESASWSSVVSSIAGRRS